MRKEDKLLQVEKIIQKGGVDEVAEQLPMRRKSKLMHTMRAVVVIVDVTKSMGMKDFKPSRLSASVVAVRQFLRLFKQSTPIAIAGLGLASNGQCRMDTEMSYDVEQIIASLEDIRIQENPGCFSFQTSLFQALSCLDQLNACFRREIVVIQSSPMTKDQHSLEQTIEIMRVSQIRLNVISMCGWTEAIKRSVQTLKGKYITVSTTEQCLKQIKQLALPPIFNPEAVRIEMVRLALVRKEQTKEPRRCLCHFKEIVISYICTVCQCVICRQPPIRCPVCGVLLVMPTDLYNHTIL